MARVTVIIPTLDEGSVIERTLARLSEIPGLEIIVVDGGSSDQTIKVSRPHAQVMTAHPGRAHQMNEGARHAKGDILLFLHADYIISEEGVEDRLRALEDPEVVGGAFRLEIDSPKWMLRAIARLANWRTRMTRVPYGDQGLFVRASVFKELGGYPTLPLMEDLELSRRLKRKGRVVILRESIRTSSRRWDKEGIAYVTLRNQLLVLFYFLGVPVSLLASWYRPAQ